MSAERLGRRAHQALAQGCFARIVSLGVTWYWLLCGRHAVFPDGHPVVLGHEAYARQPILPTALNATLDPRWDACLLGLIDRDPQRRLHAAQRIRDQPADELPM